MVRATTLLFAASLAVSAAAQGSFEMPAGFNPGIVPDSDKTSWCQGQLSTCPKICPDGVASKNTCNPTSLTFNCICGDGSTPNVAEYQNTLPFYICEENFGQCINAHPNDLAGQKECKSQRAQYCGTKKASSDDDDDSESTDADAATSSSQPQSTKVAASTTAASASTLASKTRTTASATGKTAAKSPETSATSTAAAAATDDSAAAVLLAPRGVAAAALLAVAALV